MKFTRLLLCGALLLLTGCSAHRVDVAKGRLEIVENQEAPAPLSAGDKIRVGIHVDKESVVITSDVPFIIENLTTKKWVKHGAGPFKVSPRNLKGDKWRFKIPSESSFLKIGDNQYRGELIAIPMGGKISIANELEIDDYLKGVLPREVVVTWHEESLRVQSVASRTYLASHLKRHSAQGFDICSEVHCQVFGGLSREHPKTSAAVDQTKGEILVYKGKPIGAYFHANCGGSTEQVNPVWGFDDQPYLPRKKCAYSNANPRNIWKYSVHDDAVMKALLKVNLVKGSRLKKLYVKKKSGSGRAETVTVETDAGSFDMRGNAFRLALHPEKIRSTLWTRVTRTPTAYEFAGRGWGHGVGMCQWGAKGLAERGKDYREILNFYYPSTQLVQWKR